MAHLRRLILLALIVLCVMHHLGNGSVKPDVDPPIPNPGSGQALLLLEETAPDPDYTLDQRHMLNNAKSGDVRVWLDDNFHIGNHYVLDVDTPASSLGKFWQDAVAMHKAEPLPWGAYFNGRRWVKTGTIKDTAELKKMIGMK